MAPDTARTCTGNIRAWRSPNRYGVRRLGDVVTSAGSWPVFSFKDRRWFVCGAGGDGTLVRLLAGGGSGDVKDGGNLTIRMVDASYLEGAKLRDSLGPLQGRAKASRDSGSPIVVGWTGPSAVWVPCVGDSRFAVAAGTPARSQRPTTIVANTSTSNLVALQTPSVRGPSFVPRDPGYRRCS